MKDLIEFVKKDDFSKGVLVGGGVAIIAPMMYDAAVFLCKKIKNKRIQKKLNKEIEG